MTDVPSKHVWKIKESRIVFKEKTKYFKAIHLVSGLQKLVPDFSQQPE